MQYIEPFHPLIPRDNIRGGIPFKVTHILSQNRVSHLEGHADELSVKQLLTWCAVVGLELSLAQRLGMAPEAGEAQGPGPAAATPPQW